MKTRTTLLHILWVVMIAAMMCATVAAQAPQTLTAQDRTDIQGLVNGYAKALSSCAVNDYADLFEPNGYFASGFRGHVAGRDKFIAMVQSERMCITPATPPANPSAAPAAARPGPTVVIEVTPTGVRGIADLGGAGRYEDEYVKTAKGWRFAARTVLTPAEQAAGLNAKEMTAIQHLASGPQDAPDYWLAGKDGVKRFNSAGVVIIVTGGSVTGKVYLKDGGRYDDVYEKTADGYWRFKSRAYVADAAAPAAPAATSK